MCDDLHASEAAPLSSDALEAYEAPHSAVSLGVRPARRSFITAVAAGVAALVTLPAAVARAKKMKLDLAKAAELGKPGGSRVIKVRGTEILLVRDSQSSVRAINNTCTHKKCKVKYKESSNDLYCKCHKSAFKLDGTVVAGPAPKRLTTYAASLEGDKVILDIPD